jgi:hypothetical protein
MNRRYSILLLAALSIVFVTGLIQLFRLRFAVGDVYPEYSSLRSDPLGTMAFYESLQRMPGLSVRRDFSASDELPDGKNTVYLHLAATSRDWAGLPESLLREIEHFLAAGGRLAVTFYPETSAPRRPLFEDERPAPDGSSKKKAASPGSRTARTKKAAKDEPRPPRTLLKKWWGVEFSFQALPEGERETYEPAVVRKKADLALPESLEWHSGTVFTNLDPSWHTVYARGTNAVVIERRFGRGTVVLATDSFFLSNEALRQERQAQLLAWLVGPAQEVVFDEAHFGIVDTSGIASLIRKYHLLGLVLSLLLLAGLFLWQNAVSFVPPLPDEAAPGYVAGKEAAAGFVNLLRRNLPPSEVIETCFAQWKKSFTDARRRSSPRVLQAEALLQSDRARPPRQRDAVRTYRELCRILEQRHSIEPK